MSTAPLILLPPSESKASGGDADQKNDYFAESLSELRASLSKLIQVWLRTASDAELSKVLKVRGPFLDRAKMAMRDHATGRELYLPAWQRYEGVVWSHFDPGTLSVSQRRRVLIPSGLYGLNRADDCIGDYRLTMNVSVPGVGNIANFWRESVTRALASTKRPIISLLPNEHLAAISNDDKTLLRRVTHISFVSANGEKAAGHDAKAVKGIFARAIVEKGVETISSFEWKGWTSKPVGESWCVVAPATRDLRK